MNDKTEDLTVNTAAHVTHEHFQEFEAKANNRFDSVESAAKDARKIADEAKARAEVASLAVAAKADDNRVLVLIAAEEKKKFLRGHGGGVTALVAVVALFGILFTEIHSVGGRVDALGDRMAHHFETMDNRFDKIAPPTVPVPSTVYNAPQKP